MNKIWIVIKREYITRVKKKSFLIFTILGPLMMAAVIIAPAYFMAIQEHEVRTIAVIDQTGIYDDTLINTSLLTNLRLKNEKVDIKQAMYRRLPDTKYIKFEFLPPNTSIDSVQKNFAKTDYYAMLFIPKNLLISNRIQLYSNKEIALNIKMYLSNFFEKELENQKLKSHNIDPDILKSVQTKIKVDTIKWTKKGEVKSFASEIAMVLSFFAAFLIYFLIFMFSSQVIRGVIEEKTSRIIEIIVSSVKPFQLMSGKIIGVALVGLTQFLLWIVLTFAIVNIAGVSYFSKSNASNSQQMVTTLLSDTSGANENVLQPVAEEQEDLKQFSSGIMQTIATVDWTLVIISFLIYFIGGYLLYSSLFAAIGAVVDNETDTQQFVLPITVPMLIAIVMLQSFINYPDSQVTFWFSIFPFTSPIAMMARIPFGVPVWQVVLSVVVLIATIYATIIFSAKIYRVGIFMYGKKPSYKDIFKWLKYKI